MSSIRLWSFAVVTALTLAAPLSAQVKTPAGGSQAVAASATSMSAPTLYFTPTVESATLFADAAEPAFAAPVFPGQTSESENVALMIVGGAALVVGSVIDGDAGTLMMVGGGVVGLIGLYRYLQ